MKSDNPQTVFDRYADDYHRWFDQHPILFQNEIAAIRPLMPSHGSGIEIGTGTGRFASALQIPIGTEPSPAMARYALQSGILVVNAKAEALPFHHASFDFAVMVTTVCFLENVPKAFEEAHRILKTNGCFIAAIIDRESRLGKKYASQKETNHWYRHAHFHTVGEVTHWLQEAHFSGFEFRQTLFSDTEETEKPLPGYGKGSFVVIRAKRII